jgi:hypothetical protein
MWSAGMGWCVCVHRSVTSNHMSSALVSACVLEYSESSILRHPRGQAQPVEEPNCLNLESTTCQGVWLPAVSKNRKHPI